MKQHAMSEGFDHKLLLDIKRLDYLCGLFVMGAMHKHTFCLLSCESLSSFSSSSSSSLSLLLLRPARVVSGEMVEGVGGGGTEGPWVAPRSTFNLFVCVCVCVCVCVYVCVCVCEHVMCHVFV